MREVPLTQGRTAIVDDEDFKKVAGSRWFYGGPGYAMGRPNGKTMVYMHRFLADPPEGMEIDHINGDRLDNRRANLRVVTRQQNAMNVTGRMDGKLPGTTLIKRKNGTRMWKAQMRFQGKNLYLGQFPDENEAHRAYADAAKKYRGEFARITETKL